MYICIHIHTPMYMYIYILCVYMYTHVYVCMYEIIQATATYSVCTHTQIHVRYLSGVVGAATKSTGRRKHICTLTF